MFIISFVHADSFTGDVYFTVPNTIYVTNEQIDIKGYVYQTNYSANGSVAVPYSLILNAVVNLTIKNVNGSFESNYTFITDSNGAFYSKSNFYSSAVEINASSIAGNYILRAEYLDPINVTWFSKVEINVVNQSIDSLYVGSEKAEYNPSETMNVQVEAVKLILRPS